MKVQDYSQMIRHMTRDKTTDVPGSMAHELKMASAESDAVKDMMNKQYGPGTMKYGSEIPQPSQRQDVIEIDAINRFMRDNPMADGGRIGFDNGGTSKIQTKTFKYPKKFYNRTTGKVETVYSKKPPISNVGVVSEANLAKSEASFKAFEDRFGKELLDEIAQSQYNKNFRDLAKNTELKFFKKQLNKYEDFILENKRYPNKSEATKLGIQQSGRDLGLGRGGIKGDIEKFIKKTYQSGKGGSTYIANELAKPPYNFKVNDATIRRYITEEEAAGNIVRPKKFETQLPDPNLPKDRYLTVREVTDRDLRGFTVGKSGTKVLAPKGSKYKVTFNVPRSIETTKIPKEYIGTKYYKTKQQAETALKGYQKFSKNLAKEGKANRGLREIILEQVSDPNIEADIARMKEGSDLATAHRASYKQIGKLGELYNILNLGVEAPGINSGAIRKFENKLDNLYKEQNNLIKTARRSINKGLEIPKNIQTRIDDVNKEISTVVDLTNQRVQGILVDAKTLKPYTYGINYMKTYGMGILDNKPVKEITDADLETIELNLKNQIAREKKLGKGTESFLRDRQELLKYTKELSEPGFINKIPAKLRPIALATGMTIGGISAAAAADGTEAKSILPEAAGGAAAVGTLGTKTGRKLLGRGLNLATGPTGMFALTKAFEPEGGYDLSRTVDRLGFEAEAALAPTLVKGVTDVSSKIKNPLLRKGIETLAGVRIPGLINPANVLRAARVASPIGIASLAGEGLYELGKRGYDQYQQMQGMTESEKQNFLADQYEDLGGVFGEGA